MMSAAAAKPALSIETLVANAKRAGKESQHVMLAAAFVSTGCEVHSLCVWCAEAHPNARVFRLPRGGECQACPYVGHDCLVVASEA
jgi:hypothetical protein